MECTTAPLRRAPRLVFALACTLALGLPASASARFDAAPPVATGAGPWWTASADFNHDGRPDLVSANDAGDTVSVLLAQPGGGYAEEPGSPIAVGDRPDAVAIGNFDGDGRPDLAVANFMDSTVTILLRQAGGGFSEQATVAVGAYPHSVIAADLDGDGLDDIATPDFGAATVTVLLNRPGGFEPSTFRVGANPTQIAAAKLDGDAITDLVVAGYGAGELSVLLGQPGGTFTPGPALPAGTNPVSPVIADFDGDGRKDIAVTDEAGDDIKLLMQQPDGGFAPATALPAGDGPYGLVSADVNGDGRPDLAAANQHSDDVTVLLGTPAGFVPAPFSPVPAGHLPLQLLARDLDGDARPDLAIPAYGDDAVTVLHGAGTPPRNTSLPAIVPAGAHSYRCLPGSWDGADALQFSWQRLTPDKRYVKGFSEDTVATGATYRAVAFKRIDLVALSWRFECTVAASNADWTATATSPARVLDPTL